MSFTFEGFLYLHFFVFTLLFFTFIVKFLQIRLQKTHLFFSKIMTFVMFKENFLALNLENITYLHTNITLKK